MSKSLGNTIDPIKVMETNGADIIRLWALSVDFTEDHRIGDEILKGVGDQYRKLRNSFRYLLGALDGFDESERLPVAEMPELERYMVPYNVAYLGDGHFHKGVAGDLYAEDRPEIRKLSLAIGSSPAALKLSNDMLGIAWGKLLINLNNAVNALSGATLLEELRERDYRRVVAACQREGLDLLGHAGIEPAKVGAVGPALLPAVIGSPDWLFRNVFLKAWKIDARARSSMKRIVPAMSLRRPHRIRAAVASIAECVSWPQACIWPGVREANSRPVSS